MILTLLQSMAEHNKDTQTQDVINRYVENKEDDVRKGKLKTH